MGKITIHNNSFIPARQIYSRILTEWKSFQPTNSIDEGLFTMYTMDVLRRLGNFCMREEEAILKVHNYKATLPEDFHQYYAAYKCHPRVGGQDILHQQNTFNAFSDVEIALFKRGPSCEIDCCSKNNEIIQTIRMRQYVGTGCLDYQFHNPILLRLTPYSPDLWRRGDDEGGHINGRFEDRFEECPGAPHQRRLLDIGINGNIVHTRFKHDCIYLQYYAYPLDEEGLPMIPKEEAIERAVEWYIKWQLTLNWWFDQTVPDIQSKWQKAEDMFLKYFSEAEYICKLPSFEQMLNSTRNQRTYNKVSYFSNSDWKRSVW